MYLENYIYRMDDKLPVNFCDEIIDFSLEKSQVVATVGGQSKDKMYKKEGGSKLFKANVDALRQWERKRDRTQEKKQNKENN